MLCPPKVFLTFGGHIIYGGHLFVLRRRNVGIRRRYGNIARERFSFFAGGDKAPQNDGDETYGVGDQSRIDEAFQSERCNACNDEREKFRGVAKIEQKLLFLSVKAQKHDEEYARDKIKDLTCDCGNEKRQSRLVVFGVEQGNKQVRAEQTPAENDRSYACARKNEHAPKFFRQTFFVAYEIADKQGVDGGGQKRDDFSEKRGGIVYGHLRATREYA